MIRSLVFVAITVLAVLASVAPSQAFDGEEFVFLSYGSVPTYKAMASDWQGPGQLHVFDTQKHKGHGDFVSVGLGTGLRFREITAKVKYPDQRQYFPIFIYDLSTSNSDVTWAMRIEDYAYTDSPSQMGEAVARAARMTAAHLGRPLSEGIVVLAKSSTVRPNHQLAPGLEAQGMRCESLSFVMAMMKSKVVQVLNAGTAVGTLRREHGGPRDIVVFTELPARVPPVAGIITLAPQTPLSHVNLLAINRGTPNLYATELDVIPGLKANMGKLVRLHAGDKTIRIQPISQAEAELWWQGHTRPTVVVPSPDRSGPMVVSFADADPAVLITQRIGAKASNYALLQRSLGSAIRPGFALGFDAYTRTIEAGNAPALIAAALAGQGPPSDEALKAIRDAIKASPIPDDAIYAVRTVLTNHFHGRRVRLRSSTNSEDLPAFNGAGLYRSKGMGADFDDSVLRKKLGQVFASLWTSHAFAERALYGIDHRQVAMAVLIHQAFPDEWANGVILTQREPDGLRIIVNAQRGESSVTNPEPGQTPEVFWFMSGRPTQRTAIQKSSIGGVFQGGRAEGLLPELDALTAKIHALLVAERRKQGDTTAYGVDIEFKVVKEPTGLVIYVKQARLLAGVLPL